MLQLLTGETTPARTNETRKPHASAEPPAVVGGRMRIEIVMVGEIAS